MSDPKFTETENPLEGALREIQRALSAMNMEPDPIPPERLSEEARWLSERDRWAAHSYEHMKAGRDFILRAIEEERKSNHVDHH